MFKESRKMGQLMPSIFTSTMFFFNRPIDHQSTSNDRLKPVMTAGLVNMLIDRSIANLGGHSNTICAKLLQNHQVVFFGRRIFKIKVFHLRERDKS